MFRETDEMMKVFEASVGVMLTGIQKLGFQQFGHFYIHLNNLLLIQVSNPGIRDNEIFNHLNK